MARHINPVRTHAGERGDLKKSTTNVCDRRGHRECGKAVRRSRWLSWSPFAYPFNVTGQPALSIPCGLTSSGLPVGLQIVGNAFADRLVLSAAGAYEQIRSAAVSFCP